MRLALLAFLLFPASVYAMPPAFFAFVLVAGITVGTALTVATIALTIGMTVFGVAKQKAAANKAKRMAAQARADFLSSLKDRTITRIATDAPYVFAYGETVIGSAIVAVLTSGTNDEYKHIVSVHASHECEAIDEIYINEKALGTLDGSGNVTGGDFYDNGTPRIRVQKHLGGSADAADATLLAECGAKWTAAAVLRGFTYTVTRIDLRLAELQNGIPDIKVKVRGKKLYDVRTALTAYSANPALVIYDYLTSEMCGVPATDIPAAYYITAANVCDESNSFGALYTCNGTITSEQDQGQVLESLAQCMAGGIVSVDWSCWAGKYIAPTFALSQSDIVGTLAVTPGISDADIINGVRGQNITAENLYVLTDYKPYQNATYRTADGKDKYASVDFPFTNSQQRVDNLARIMVEDMRMGFTIKAQFSLKALDVKIGSRLTFTSAFLGQTASVYIVTDKKYSPTSEIELTLKADAASIYDLADAVVLDAIATNGGLNPFTVNPILWVTCYSGTNALLKQSDKTIISRILVTWSTPPQTVDEIQVEFKKNTETAWHRINVDGTATSLYLYPVEDGSIYNVRVRAARIYINANSIWTSADNHTVIGKTERPANIPSLTIDGASLAWGEVADIDLDGYLFKYHYGLNLDWGAANPLHTGIIKASPWIAEDLPYGAVTIMGKAVDTSGNESAASVNIFTNLGDAPVANVVETHSFDPAYPGTLTDCTVSGGDLIAGSVDSFYGDNLQSFYGEDGGSFYKPSAYKKMIYVTDLMPVASVVLVGSNMTLSLITTGIDVYVEYKILGDNPFYGADTAPFYTADSAGFYDDGLSDWLAWPGLVVTKKADYQFRVAIGSGVTQGKITYLAAIIDAPDMEEFVNDMAIGATATTIPYTKVFTSINSVTATLQANASGAITVEINKITSPLHPSILAYNVSHTAVAGATADVRIRGY